MVMGFLSRVKGIDAALGPRETYLFLIYYFSEKIVNYLLTQVPVRGEIL
jgi:hypothetical protein